MAYGYIVARGESYVIALHDCDILSYTRNLLNRLVYPTVMTALDYEFCKGYYSRVTERMHGRVTRLMVTPLIGSLITMLGHLPILQYFRSFRYPLAGEFSMVSDLARVNRIPSDWGLEVGVLAEVFRNCSLNRICQVELCPNYDHKHQELSPEDPGRGLNKMAVDVCSTIFRILASTGVILGDGFFNTLRATFLKEAQDLMGMYHDDAVDQRPRLRSSRGGGGCGDVRGGHADFWGNYSEGPAGPSAHSELEPHSMRFPILPPRWWKPSTRTTKEVLTDRCHLTDTTDEC